MIKPMVAGLVRDPFDAELSGLNPGRGFMKGLFLWEFVCCFVQRCLQASRNNKDSAVVRIATFFPHAPGQGKTLISFGLACLLNHSMFLLWRSFVVITMGSRSLLTVNQRLMVTCGWCTVLLRTVSSASPRRH